MSQRAVDFHFESYLPPRHFKSRHHSLQINTNLTIQDLSIQKVISNLSDDVLWELLSEQPYQNALEGIWQLIVILGYSLLITVGIVSNTLVCFVVVRQLKRRAAQFEGRTRNLFILNLALADLVLCCMCMPLTLHNLLHVNWTMGIVLCKLSPVIQAANMLGSAGTITAIAVDRYKTIMRSPQRKASTVKTSIAKPTFGITALWIFSLLLASPLFFFSNLDPVYVNDVFLYNRCVERWPSDFSKLAFSSALTAVQFIIPVYTMNGNTKIAPDDETLTDEKRPLHKEFLNISRKESICSDNSQRSDSSRKNSDCSDSKPLSTPDISPRKSKRYMSSFRGNSDFSFSFSMLSRECSKKTPHIMQRELQRNRRATLLLSCIACVYAVSWLPYHVYNFITHAAPFLAASSKEEYPFFHPKTLYKAFAVAHMLAMTSVCVNPFLYGWLNTNFRREFRHIYESLSPCLANMSNKNYIRNNNNNNSEFEKDGFGGEIKQETRLSFHPNRQEDCVVVSLFQSQTYQHNV